MSSLSTAVAFVIALCYPPGKDDFARLGVPADARLERRWLRESGACRVACNGCDSRRALRVPTLPGRGEARSVLA